MKKVLALILFLLSPITVSAETADKTNVSCDNVVYTSVIFERTHRARNNDEAAVLREESLKCAEAYEAFLFGSTANPKITPEFFQESFSGEFMGKLVIPARKVIQIRDLAKQHNKLP